MLLEPYTNRTTPAHKQPTMGVLRALALQDEAEVLRRTILKNQKAIADNRKAVADNERVIAELNRRLAVEEAFQENYRRQQDYLRRTDVDDATKLDQVMGEWEAER